MTGPVRLTIVANEQEAELACGLLRQEQIMCMYRITDLAFGSGGELPQSGAGPREVLVRPEDLMRARELLGSLDDITESGSRS
jgi:hypothetical protein